MSINNRFDSRRSVRLEPWGVDDLGLLEAVMGDPDMTAHLGGPKPSKKIAERQRRYEQTGSFQFKIIAVRGGAAAGWVGFWERDWNGERVFEIGWSVLPWMQGCGLATAAAAQVLDLARSTRSLRFVHAFPSVRNATSNEICRKLGFELVEECDIEFPPGKLMRCNDWRYDLSSASCGVV